MHASPPQTSVWPQLANAMCTWLLGCSLEALHHTHLFHAVASVQGTVLVSPAREAARRAMRTRLTGTAWQVYIGRYPTSRSGTVKPNISLLILFHFRSPETVDRLILSLSQPSQPSHPSTSLKPTNPTQQLSTCLSR
jgi:hypothetical protein